MGNLWLFHGFFTVDITKPWSIIKYPWYIYGIDHEKSMVFPWIFYGTDHGSPWSSMGTGPLIFHGKPMEYFCKGSLINRETQEYSE